MTSSRTHNGHQHIHRARSHTYTHRKLNKTGAKADEWQGTHHIVGLGFNWQQRTKPKAATFCRQWLGSRSAHRWSVQCLSFCAWVLPLCSCQGHPMCSDSFLLQATLYFIFHRTFSVLFTHSPVTGTGLLLPLGSVLSAPMHMNAGSCSCSWFPAPLWFAL